jgi:hypothetical protein
MSLRGVGHRPVDGVVAGEEGWLCTQLRRAVAQPAKNHLDALQIVIDGVV